MVGHLSLNRVKGAVVGRVNGELWELHRPLEGDCELHILGYDSPEGRQVSKGRGGGQKAATHLQNIGCGPRLRYTVPPPKALVCSQYFKISIHPSSDFRLVRFSGAFTFCAIISFSINASGDVLAWNGTAIHPPHHPQAKTITFAAPCPLWPTLFFHCCPANPC